LAVFASQCARLQGIENLEDQGNHRLQLAALNCIKTDAKLAPTPSIEVVSKGCIARALQLADSPGHLPRSPAVAESHDSDAASETSGVDS
jgi:hypothetical protein